MAYKRTEVKFASRGVNVTRPPDLLEDAQPYMKNMRQYLQGVLQNRPGMNRVNSVALPSLDINSITRLNNDLPSSSFTFARFLGADGKLYSDNIFHTAFTERASGFFDDPLQFAVMRPFESPEPWLYVSDAAKSGKARVDGTFQNQGIAAPVVAPYAQQAPTSLKVIDEMEAVGAWANGGTAGAITAPSRIATTIAKIVYDTGTTGWATVQPTLQDESLQPGMRLIVNAAETVLVESVADAVTTTTISAIQYDFGTTGPCTIQLAAPSDLLARDYMLRINSGGGSDEVVRVLSVTDGPGGLPSLRCSTVNTHAAAESITGVRSFRASFTLNHAVAETLTSNNLHSTVATGIGYITLVTALDLSVVNSRPITADDWIHISIKLDDLALLTEGRIAFDVDSATNDFTQNYYYWPFRANDLVPATVSSITALQASQRIIQRGQIGQTINRTNVYGNTKIYQPDSPFGDTDYGPGQYGGGQRYGGIMYDPPAPPDPVDDPAQTTTGASQWTELRIRVGDLMRYRVGSDTSRTLHDVAAIRIQIQVTGSTVMDVDAWWIGGTYGPDINIGAPYNYTYVYRSSLTGAVSNPAPPMRSGISPHRQSVLGTVTPSSDAQVDQIDIYRTGGALIAEDNTPAWFYVMSVPNSSPTFTDDQADDIVIRNRQLDFSNYQPFLDRDVTKSGTCSVVGTEVTRLTGDIFNVLWPPGSLIIINNVTYPFYAPPTTISKVSLSQSAGAQTGVNWQMISPRLMAQPMPALWGPFGGGTFSPVLFACGSGYQAGHVFWTRPGNADANGEFDSLELTSPSEPLMNGVVFRSQAYVFSSESLYILTPTIIASELRFSGAKVAGSRGLFSRFAMCVGDEGIFYLSRDGIYLTSGGESICLTDELLYPLFPHEGVAGSSINGIAPPDFTGVLASKYLRLSYGESELYFDFLDTDGHHATWLFDIKLKGWFYYRYDPEILVHYIEEGRGTNSLLLGADDGFLYTSGGSQDNGVAIPVEVWTNRYDGGDPRGNKQWANGMLDFDSNGVDATVRVYADNESVLLNTLTVNKATRGQQILDFNQSIRRNLLMKLTGSSPLTLYGYSWEHTPVSVSELTEQRNAYATSWQFDEYGHLYYIQLGHISTTDLTLSITVDNGTPDTYAIPNTGGGFEKTWIVLHARKGKLFDLSFTSTEEFQLIVSQSLVLGKEFKSSGPYQPIKCFGDTT